MAYATATGKRTLSFQSRLRYGTAMPVTASRVVPITGASWPTANPASKTRARWRPSAVDPRSAVVASAAISRTRDETQYTAAAVGISTSSLGGMPGWGGGGGGGRGAA